MILTPHVQVIHTRSPSTPPPSTSPIVDISLALSHAGDAARPRGRPAPQARACHLTVERHRFYVRVMPSDADRAWQHPWLRISLLLRTMLDTRWDAETWPQVKAEFKNALALRSQIRRAGWFN